MAVIVFILRSDKAKILVSTAQRGAINPRYRWSFGGWEAKYFVTIEAKKSYGKFFVICQRGIWLLFIKNHFLHHTASSFSISLCVLCSQLDSIGQSGRAHWIRPHCPFELAFLGSARCWRVPWFIACDVCGPRKRVEPAEKWKKVMGTTEIFATLETNLWTDSRTHHHAPPLYWLYAVIHYALRSHTIALNRSRNLIQKVSSELNCAFTLNVSDL